MRITLAVIATVILVAVAATAAVGRGDGASEKTSGDHSSSRSERSLGINPRKGTCPKAVPDRLPPNALAGATNDALAEAPKLYPQNTRGRYATLAQLVKSGSPRSGTFKECGKRLNNRSVEVDMIFPHAGYHSASLSQASVFVARFDGRYRVWGIAH